MIPYAVPYQMEFQAICGPLWIRRAAQAKAESGFNPNARSPVGAQGIMQFMPGAWKDWGKGNPCEIIPAITAGHRYMVWLEKRYHFNWGAALGGYNAGPGNIDRALRIADSFGMIGEDRWARTLPQVTGKHSAETIAYYPRIKRFETEIKWKTQASLPLL